MNSTMMNLNLQDILKGLVMAVLGGLLLPVLAIFQAPDFSIVTADWHAISVIALNGAAAGFASYIFKNLFSDSDGKFLGKIG